MSIQQVLWAVKIGEPDWREEVITARADQFKSAKAWAIKNGFDRFRVAKIDMGVKPDFVSTIRRK